MSDSDLTADYAKAGFGGRLEFGARPALLLVDMVDAYLAAQSPLYLGPTGPLALAKAAELAATFEALGAPIILTRVDYAPGMPEAGHFAKKAPALKCFERGSPFARFPAELEAERRIVLSKHFPSAFFETELADLLRAKGVDTVVIGGYSTSGCVRASALDALQHGFIPFVASDACADRDSRPHSANLFDLQAKYAEVRRSAEIVDLMTRRGV